jgi:hypothetical protein
VEVFTEVPEMKLLNLVVKPVVILLFILIPAGRRLIEIFFDPDHGESYIGLIVLSFALSLTAFFMVFLLHAIPLPVQTPEQQQVWFWYQFAVPVVLWIGAWAVYKTAVDNFG